MKSGAVAARNLIVSPLLAALALLIVIGGVSFVGAALKQPAAIIGGFVAVAAVALLAEGGYREWQRTDQQRRQLVRALASEHARDAVIQRLEAFAKEFEALREEVPPDPDQPGSVPTPERRRWDLSTAHLSERVKSELRRHAPGFLDYWDSNPPGMPSQTWTAEFANAYLNASVQKLRHIIERLSTGHSTPSAPWVNRAASWGTEP